MPGPCPEGYSTPAVHEGARCQDRGNCTGPGCRVRRRPYVDRILQGLQERTERGTMEHL